MGRHFKKIIEEVGELSMQQQGASMRERMGVNLREFAQKVEAFNKLGEALYNGGDFAQIAEELEGIAEGAESYTLRETDGQWFDQVTVKRNMKELRGYTSEFRKVAHEARALQERMTALYEDCGRVLGRYFEIKEYGQADGLTTEPQKSPDELQVNARPGIREANVEVKPCAKCGTKVKGVNDKYCSSCKALLGIKESKMCEGCGKPMSECTCPGHVHEDEVSNADPQKAYNAYKKARTSGTVVSSEQPKSYDEWYKTVWANKKGIDKENISPTGGKRVFESIKLKKLLEDIDTDYPKDDWVKLDVPMLKYDVALEFEKDLKKQGFEVHRHDWKERAAQGEEFSDFWVRKDDFDAANKYAVGEYQRFDNNARMEKS